MRRGEAALFPNGVFAAPFFCVLAAGVGPSVALAEADGAGYLEQHAGIVVPGHSFHASARMLA